MFGIVYKSTNKIDGKSYIGITTQDFEKYKNKHLRLALKGSQRYKIFYNAIRKYGKDNFEWEVLAECIDKDSLCEKEIYFIEKFNTYIGFVNSNGYNMTLGGEHYSYKLIDHPNCEEIKAKLSSIRKNKTYDEIYGNDAERMRTLRSIQFKNRCVSDVVKNKAKFINMKCYLLCNIDTHEYKFLHSREDVEQLADDSFYRVSKLKSRWVMLKQVKVLDNEYASFLTLSETEIKSMLTTFLECNILPSKIRNKRTTSNITKGKTYEEIYGIEESNKRKETWNGRRT